MTQITRHSPLNWPEIIHEVGRGAHSARPLTAELAEQVMDAVLHEAISPIQLGALMMAYRIKGETLDEMQGFARAIHRHLPVFAAPKSKPSPVVFSCYNGTRKQANLLPWLVLALQRAGVPVLLHGWAKAGERHGTAALLQGMGVRLPESVKEAQQIWHDDCLVYVPTDILCPALAKVLRLRDTMGVRNSTHTLVKCINPCGNSDAIRVIAATHPDYLVRYAEFLHAEKATGLLIKGTEGEPFLHPTRAGILQTFRQGTPTEEAIKTNENNGFSVQNADFDSTLAWLKTAWYPEKTGGVYEKPACIPSPLWQQFERCLALSEHTQHADHG